MKRLGLVLACVAVLALLALPAAASAAYTTSAECLGCHAPAGAGAITKVDFSTATGAGAVNYAACNACHNVAKYDFIGNFYHGHVTDYGPVCTNCHSTYQGVGDIARLPIVNLGASGNFASASSLTKSPAELHAIHVNGSWEKTIAYRGGICQGCHAPAACSSCHAGAVPHATHSASAFGAVSYTVAVGQPFNALTPGLRTDTVNCVNASCHALAAAATPAFKPFCGDGTCHKPPVDTADRTIEHGYDPTMHTSAWTLGATCGGVGCHVPGQRDLMDVHNNFRPAKDFTCAGCHGSADTNVKAAITAGNTACDACHTGASLTTGHYDSHYAVPALANNGTGNYAYYYGTQPGHTPTPACAGCHAENLMDEHVGTRRSDGTYDRFPRYTSTGAYLTCASCHSSTSPNVVTAIMAGVTKCDACHTVHGPIAAIHAPGFPAGEASVCDDCHTGTLDTMHPAQVTTTGGKTLQDCAVCHGYFDGARGTQIQAAISSGQTSCSACHASWHTDLVPKHTTTATTVGSIDCTRCHDSGPETGINVMPVHASDTLGPCAVCHANAARVPDIAAKTAACSSCHPTEGVTFHRTMTASHTYSGGAGSCDAAGCHSVRLETEHAKYLARYKNADGTQTYPDSCALCHQNASPTRIDWTKATADCSTCHTTSHPAHVAKNSTGCLGSTCHGTTGDVLPLHAARTEGACAVCHSNPTKGDLTVGKTTFDCAQSGCHAGATSGHKLREPFTNCAVSGCHGPGGTKIHSVYSHRNQACTTCHGADAPGCTKSGCHSADGIHSRSAHDSKPCSFCHTSGTQNIPEPYAECDDCHSASNIHSETRHDSLVCTGCHGKTPAACSASGCHSADSIHSKSAHDRTCTQCHTSGVTVPAVREPFGGCNSCHSMSTIHDKSAHQVFCLTCHGDAAPGCTKCHSVSNIHDRDAHERAACTKCHESGTPVLVQPAEPFGACAECHGSGSVHSESRHGGLGCSDCHSATPKCGNCHSQTSIHGISRHEDAGCMKCHPTGISKPHAAISSKVGTKDSSWTTVCRSCHGSVHSRSGCYTCHAPAGASSGSGGSWGGWGGGGGEDVHQVGSHMRNTYCSRCHNISTTDQSKGLDCLACHPDGRSTGIVAPAFGSVTGYVKTAMGAPIPGAMVYASNAATPAVSGADGKYTVIAVPVASSVTVTCTAAGYATQVVTVAVDKEISTTRNFILTAVPTGTISGKVTAAGGVLIPGATVTANGTAAVIGADGSFSFSNLVYGTYTVTAAAPGYVTQTLTVTVGGAGPYAANFVLAPAPIYGTLSGQVTDSRGRSISGVTIAVAGKTGTTDSSGRYTITGIATGTYTATYSKSGYRSSSQSVTITSGQTTTKNVQLSSAR